MTTPQLVAMPPRFLGSPKVRETAPKPTRRSRPEATPATTLPPLPERPAPRVVVPVLPPPAEVSLKASDDAPSPRAARDASKARATPRRAGPSPVVYVPPRAEPRPPKPPKPPLPLSQWEAVVLAILDLDAADASPAAPYAPVTRTDLILAAWRRWPGLFGLPGAPEHPDSQRLLCRLSEAIKSGWVLSDKRGGYSPSPKALRTHDHLRARAARAGASTPASGRAPDGGHDGRR